MISKSEVGATPLDGRTGRSLGAIQATDEETPEYRILRCYALDPGFSTQLQTMSINEVPYKIPWEHIEPGPFGEYLDVIDIDPASNCFYEPVNLDSKLVLGQNGLCPSEGNPQFHQQMVYAVIMKTIRHFEFALGRKLIWRNRDIESGLSSQDPDYMIKLKPHLREEFVQRLRVYPHAFRDSNAYYDPQKVSLLFGYFTAGDEVQGSNYPGGVVFTCLSPDVVSHESTHAILDSIHNRFIEDTNPDVGAFHEGFSDIVALLQRFTFKELVEHQLATTQGRLDKYNVLGELATQFGMALEDERGALRGAIGKVNENGVWEKLTPNPADYKEIFEPHDRGALLVATVFDAFQRLYQHRTQDLIRIATNGTGELPKGNISPDLVKRLALEACTIASHLLHICIRALDYCPPCDITFGNYLQALITADLDAAPEDEHGYRIALIEAFRARGIFPDRVNTLSIDSLKWSKPDLTEHETKLFTELARFLKPKISQLSMLEDRKEIYVESHLIQAELHRFITNRMQNETDDWDSFLCKLGLTAKPFILSYQNQEYEVPVPPLEIHKVRPAFRMGREGKQISQVLIVLSQTARIKIPRENPAEGEPDTETINFRGGCSLILSLGNLDRLEYVISKNVKSQYRFSQQMDYQHSGEDFSMGLTTYADNTGDNYDLSFKQLHFHTR
jgi:hypothetical protein